MKILMAAQRGKDDNQAAYRSVATSDASNFLKQWVRKNITPTTAHIREDTLTAGRLAEECLWEAQGQDLSEADVTDAAGGNLLTFMVSELNRAADREIDAADREFDDE